MGADQPGIVAAVTGVLVDQRCNLEDTSMTILGGHFAMMLLVAAPEGLSASALERALEPVSEQLGLVVAVRPIAEEGGAPSEGTAWRVSVHGADRPGIVHRVASACAAAGANVVDLSTRVVEGAERPGYVLLLDVVLPATASPEQLAADLERASVELDVDCVLRPAEPEIL